MTTLQVKRTKKPLTSISNLVLANGEILVAQKSSDREFDYLFIGDGISNIGDLLLAKRYKILTESFNLNSIEDGTLTVSKLNKDNLDEYIKATVELPEILSDLNLYKDTTNNILNRLDNNVDGIIKYVICSTSQSNSDKIVYTDSLSKMSQGENFAIYNGTIFSIKFSSADITDNVITMSILNNSGEVVIPATMMYAADKPLNSGNKLYKWKSGSSQFYIYTNTTGKPEDGKFELSGTEVADVIASWCYSNDTTLINGSAIATGTITSEQIRAGSISTDKIAVGALSAELFNDDTKQLLNNISTIRANAAYGATAVCYAYVEADDGTGIIRQNYIDITLGDDTLYELNLNEPTKPKTGSSFIVEFDKSFSENVHEDYRARILSVPGERVSNLFKIVCFYKGSFYDIGVDLSEIDDESTRNYIQKLRWNAHDARQLIFDGSNFVMSSVSNYARQLASQCLANDQTWISGSTILTGTIVADQIVGGTIDAGLITLGSRDIDGKEIGGFKCVSSFAGSTETKGALIYGADQENVYVIVTDGGVRAESKYGSIGTYGNGIINIQGSSIKIGDSNSGKSASFGDNKITIGYSGSTVNIKGSVYSTSDENAKNSISELSLNNNIYDFYRQLKPVEYKFNGDNRKHTGFIAQDVEQSLKDNNVELSLVGESDGLKTLSYNDFIALNTVMIQKLQDKVNELEEELNELRGKK